MLPQCIAAGCAVCVGVSSFPDSTVYLGDIGCSEEPTSKFTVNIKENSSLYNLESAYADVTVTGKNVRIENVTLNYPIRVLSEDATNLSFTNVNCNSCPAAVIVMGSTTTRHGAVSVGLTLSGVVGETYSAALAHTSGTVDCNSGESVLLQPVGSEKTTTASCITHDLGELLSVFGEPYLLNFFDGKPHNNAFLITAVKYMTIATVLMLVVSYLSAYHIWKEHKLKKLHKE